MSWCALTEDEAAEYVGRVARKLWMAGAISPAGAQDAAHLAVIMLESELADAAQFARLRDAMCKTMADPDSWDGDGTEACALIDYVQHLAKANFGDCEVCGQQIPATARYEIIGYTGGPQRLEIRACATCV